MLNKISFYTDNNIYFKNPDCFSRIACLHFQWYESKEEIIHDFDLHKRIFNVLYPLSPYRWTENYSTRTYSNACPQDYADDIDTMAF